MSCSMAASVLNEVFPPSSKSLDRLLQRSRFDELPIRFNSGQKGVSRALRAQQPGVTVVMNSAMVTVMLIMVRHDGNHFDRKGPYVNLERLQLPMNLVKVGELVYARTLNSPTCSFPSTMPWGLGGNWRDEVQAAPLDLSLGQAQVNASLPDWRCLGQTQARAAPRTSLLEEPGLANSSGRTLRQPAVWCLGGSFWFL
ncbi:hypothetical protein AK812_SmicGene29243 [Symbiodinium microadriaticum]|uniref:Uncharacterized protein n=1 Tax=Symbiodinium microadriaticum TaxID=2951 RepID=A0A1Q9D2C2_SYMMI|nr:hypothetical protein AK812_SmicGene29243 [Symbiodinium microadriaticum]